MLFPNLLFLIFPRIHAVLCGAVLLRRLHPQGVRRLVPAAAPPPFRSASGMHCMAVRRLLSKQIAGRVESSLSPALIKLLD